LLNPVAYTVTESISIYGAPRECHIAPQLYTPMLSTSTNWCCFTFAFSFALLYNCRRIHFPSRLEEDKGKL